MQSRFRNRAQAGQRLAEQLRQYAHRSDVIVLALPRGGVPVGFEVARALNVPLDVFIVRKLGVPWQPELAMGAIASGDTVVFNENVLDQLAGSELVDSVIARERVELVRRERMYRDEQPPPQIQNRIVILVDDGLATGATMRAAVQAIRAQSPAKLVVAVPVGSSEVCADIARLVDEMICTLTPESFYAVGLWYDDFTETSDQEVRILLREANQFQHDSAEEKR